MVSSDPDDKLSDKYCKYDVKCDKAGTSHCQRCEQIYCMDHYLEHQTKIQEHFQCAIETQGSLNEKLKSLLSQLSANGILYLIKQIYQFKIKSDKIEKTINRIQEQLQHRNNQDQQDSNGLDHHENDIERLIRHIDQLKFKFEQINNYSQQITSQEQSHIHPINVQPDNLSETIKPPVSNLISTSKNNYLRPAVDTFRNSGTELAENTSALSHLFFRQMTPAIIDLKENEVDLTEEENETYLEEEEEEEIIGVISSNTPPKISQKIRLSNNIINVLRGPFKIMLDGTMHIVDVCAQKTHLNDIVLKTVKEELDKQNKIPMEQRTTNNSLKPPFVEITSDWKFEGENSDQGFSSVSIWMRDPQGQRILVKTQELSISAANERLAYTLGVLLGLPINEVQISIYENNLVTLHTDVAHENEKTMTFMDLPKQIRKNLFTDPIMGSMDLFDHIIQNVDRNARNILITIPKTTDINDDSAKLKIHLIDHSASFGMGKLNGISVVASKFHTRHLSVVKFNPQVKAKKFRQYLNKLPIEDRILISKTLNRFAAITNHQIDSCIIEVQHLLSSSQYNRIHNVLYRQRDIVRRYAIQWGIYPRSSSVKSNETKQFTFEVDDKITHF